MKVPVKKLIIFGARLEFVLSSQLGPFASTFGPGGRAEVIEAGRVLDAVSQLYLIDDLRLPIPFR